MTEDEESDESHETEAFEAQQTVAREEAAALLHDLADGVASGSVGFDDGAFTVDVPATVDLELEYEQEDDEHEIEVELEWDGADDTDEDETDGHGEEEDAEDEPDDHDEDEEEADDHDDEEGDDADGGDADSETGDGEEETGDSDGADDSTRGERTQVAAATPGSSDEAVVAADDAGVAGVVGPGPEPRSRARFELYRDRAEEWRWRLVHHNGNIIADGGEGYNRRRSARNGLESVRRNAPGASVVEQD